MFGGIRCSPPLLSSALMASQTFRECSLHLPRFWELLNFPLIQPMTQGSSNDVCQSAPVGVIPELSDVADLDLFHCCQKWYMIWFLFLGCLRLVLWLIIWFMVEGLFHTPWEESALQALNTLSHRYARPIALQSIWLWCFWLIFCLHSLSTNGNGVLEILLSPR